MLINHGPADPAISRTSRRSDIQEYVSLDGHLDMTARGSMEAHPLSAELRFADKNSLCSMHFEDLLQLSSELRKDFESSVGPGVSSHGTDESFRGRRRGSPVPRFDECAGGPSSIADATDGKCWDDSTISFSDENEGPRGQPLEKSKRYPLFLGKDLQVVLRQPYTLNPEPETIKRTTASNSGVACSSIITGIFKSVW